MSQGDLEAGRCSDGGARLARLAARHDPGYVATAALSNAAAPAGRRAVIGLPEWPAGTPGVLCAAGPHPIPVSTLIRANHDRILIALGARRATLRKLRADPRAALCVMAAGVAFTAHGRAQIVRDPLEAAPGNVAVELRVERVQDHLADGRSEMLDGARWRWVDPEAEKAAPGILAELREIAAESAPE